MAKMRAGEATAVLVAQEEVEVAEAAAIAEGRAEAAAVVAGQSEAAAHVQAAGPLPPCLRTVSF